MVRGAGQGYYKPETFLAMGFVNPKPKISSHPVANQSVKSLSVSR